MREYHCVGGFDRVQVVPPLTLPILAGSTQLLTATDFLRNMRVFKKTEADAAKELYPTDHYVM
jgi:hypothetical protein